MQRGLFGATALRGVPGTLRRAMSLSLSFPGFTTFRARLFWSVIPIVLALALLYGVIDLRERQGLVEEEFLKRGQAMSANLSDTSKLAVFAENQPLLQSSIRAIVGDPDVA